MFQFQVDILRFPDADRPGVVAKTIAVPQLDSARVAASMEIEKSNTTPTKAMIYQIDDLGTRRFIGSMTEPWNHDTVQTRLDKADSTARPGYYAWAAMKARYPEALIIVEVDDGFRTYEQDASETGAEVISSGQLQSTVNSLTSRGHKVAVFEYI